jgi:hypothetical protein
MSTPREVHEERRERFAEEAAVLEARQARLSLARLGTFVAAVVVGIAGVSQASLPLIGGGALLVVFFFFLVLVHARLIGARDLARIRRDVHVRHLQRLDGEWTGFSSTGLGRVDIAHPYAWDIDLVGSGSLFQRIDVTHTEPGARRLAEWLATPTDPETAAARQEAVRELAGAVALRSELEATAEIAAGDDKLDSSPFLAFTKRKAFVAPRP